MRNNIGSITKNNQSDELVKQKHKAGSFCLSFDSGLLLLFYHLSMSAFSNYICKKLVMIYTVNRVWAGAT